MARRTSGRCAVLTLSQLAWRDVVRPRLGSAISLARVTEFVSQLVRYGGSPCQPPAPSPTTRAPKAPDGVTTHPRPIRVARPPLHDVDVRCAMHDGRPRWASSCHLPPAHVRAQLASRFYSMQCGRSPDWRQLHSRMQVLSWMPDPSPTQVLYVLAPREVGRSALPGGVLFVAVQTFAVHRSTSTSVRRRPLGDRCVLSLDGEVRVWEGLLCGA